ncbi:lipopolysaccharide assembly protein LapA domain-containing protein [Vibrio hannami]|uniref:LapA family protein n=1 Tax=Vibrio hannami TaxID=2717094 RepID=UPI00241086BC|nr:lipopolysaccharide assembly protein LapA domain-containing protein [Vibrio hannami]MDG3087649.1 lipopolysaccharide assembly protein LapA domain-containing protein [Vibrio hannami]
MKIIKIILVIALFLVALALGAQNQEVVTFNYLLAKGDFHLSTLLGVVFVSGFALAWLIFGSMQLKSQLTIKKLNRQLRKHSSSTPAVENKA